MKHRVTHQATGSLRWPLLWIVLILANCNLLCRDDSAGPDYERVATDTAAVAAAEPPTEMPPVTLAPPVETLEESAETTPVAPALDSPGAIGGAPCNPLVEPACALADLESLTISAENRCSPYDRDDYPYSQSVEDDIIDGLGGVFSPYTGERFEDKYKTDIEHMIAVSEAHDSGLCEAGMLTRRAFASDQLNLTLASPSVNRHQKRHKDAAEWLPDLNQCWFAARVVAVRKKYGLTIDQPERKTLERVLRGCTSLVLTQ